jgi:hypothetical protein
MHGALPPLLYGVVVLKHRDNFTFNYIDPAFGWWYCMGVGCVARISEELAACTFRVEK